MNSGETTEHFATLFDIHFLPQALCLYESLRTHAQPFHLWVLCMDEAVEHALRILDLPQISVIPLADVETAALLEAKTDRSAGEYCWTLTPFVPQVVMEMCPDARRVTYLDADLFFFDSPHTLLEEFEASGKDVLITDHAYAPEYELGHRFGRFCVQFMTFRNTNAGRGVLHWWQDRCVEWCYAREEDGKFGDQKYLDDWPERFRDAVHVLKQTEKTLAPWNIAHVGRELGRAKPVFFHFQSLRLYKPHRLRLFSEFRVGARNMWIYRVYVPMFRRALASMRAAGIEPRPTPVAFGRFYWLLMMLQGRLRFASV